jgi:hypothetical protein
MRDGCNHFASASGDSSYSRGPSIFVVVIRYLYPYLARLDRVAFSDTLSDAMPGPLISEVLPDLLEEMVHLLQGTGAEALGEQLRGLRIESVCDCGDENCASFATAAEVKVDSVVELEALEGYLIIDLNPANQICFIEVLGRQDVRYLLDEYYESLK